MVLGTTKRTSECQYVLIVDLWHSDETGVTECHKAPLRDLWISERKENLIRLVLVRFEPCAALTDMVQSAKSIANRQSAKIFSIDMGRGIRIHTSILQDSGCAASCKKSHNQKGYIGKNQNVLKCFIHKACRGYHNRFNKLKKRFDFTQ